jgi:hypothetical protein
MTFSRSLQGVDREMPFVDLTVAANEQIPARFNSSCLGREFFSKRGKFVTRFCDCDEGS